MANSEKEELERAMQESMKAEEQRKIEQEEEEEMIQRAITMSKQEADPEVTQEQPAQPAPVNTEPPKEQ